MANREIVNPETVFQADGFTHGVISNGGRILFISGQVAWDKDFQLVGEGDLAAQSRKVYENIQHVLNEARASWENVVKMNIYTTRPHENLIIAGVKQEFLQGVPSPAETLIGVHGLASPDLLIEIEAYAVLPD